MNNQKPHKNALSLARKHNLYNISNSNIAPFPYLTSTSQPRFSPPSYTPLAHPYNHTTPPYHPPPQTQYPLYFHPFPLYNPTPQAQKKSPEPCPDPEKYLKPDYSYASLIAQALTSSPSKKRSLNEIYEFILKKYPYFKNHDGWQVCFTKTKREDSIPGKGHFWTITPGFERFFIDGHFKSFKLKSKLEDSSSPNNAVTLNNSDNSTLINASTPETRILKPKLKKVSCFTKDEIDDLKKTLKDIPQTAEFNLHPNFEKPQPKSEPNSQSIPSKRKLSTSILQNTVLSFVTDVCDSNKRPCFEQKPVIQRSPSPRLRLSKSYDDIETKKRSDSSSSKLETSKSSMSLKEVSINSCNPEILGIESFPLSETTESDRNNFPLNNANLIHDISDFILNFNNQQSNLNQSDPKTKKALHDIFTPFTSTLTTINTQNPPTNILTKSSALHEYPSTTNISPSLPSQGMSPSFPGNLSDHTGVSVKPIDLFLNSSCNDSGYHSTPNMPTSHYENFSLFSDIHRSSDLTQPFNQFLQESSVDYNQLFDQSIADYSNKLSNSNSFNIGDTVFANNDGYNKPNPFPLNQEPPFNFNARGSVNFDSSQTYSLNNSSYITGSSNTLCNTINPFAANPLFNNINNQDTLFQNLLGNNNHTQTTHNQSLQNIQQTKPQERQNAPNLLLRQMVSNANFNPPGDNSPTTNFYPMENFSLYENRPFNDLNHNQKI
ncbi:hypothetical protein BB559_001666 [Furculomyces boomerangus]|uniref:Fork-head domain-containing protein n=1 Tax=Furculomyces boomerangus TaxID=61424 RepID=A0A2T9Z159_9FUNG|nr:hypothetical protein BB559_001666 [Furculomyces boomerangus]